MNFPAYDCATAAQTIQAHETRWRYTHAISCKTCYGRYRPAAEADQARTHTHPYEGTPENTQTRSVTARLKYRLKNADFPTFGRPTSATVIGSYEVT